MGEIYHAAYEKVETQWQAVIAPGLYKPEAAPVLQGKDWVGVGSGWQSYGPQLNVIYDDQLQGVEGALLPTASAIMRLALPRFFSGDPLLASAALPIYIRNRVALKTAERELGMRL
jgi:tRNA threonylcarbamoyladenosine biosynthesis protein TsaB